jgi:hypothetical protein
MDTTMVSENRGLWNTAFPGVSKGSVEMWVEMVDSTEASNKKAIPLAPPPPLQLELRVVIWNVEKCKLVENGEKTDIKVYGDLNCQSYKGVNPAVQMTDEHLGSKDGHGEFNWRFVWPNIEMSNLTKSCTMAIALYDYNLLGDTFIGSVSLDLKKYLEKVQKDMESVEIDHCTLKVEDPNEEDPAEKLVGEITLSMWVMTSTEAMAKEAGMGREDPNDNPPLLTPTEGRGWGAFFDGLNFSLPDFGLMKKLMPVIILVFIGLIGAKQAGLL